MNRRTVAYRGRRMAQLRRRRLGAIHQPPAGSMGGGTEVAQKAQTALKALRA